MSSNDEKYDQDKFDVILDDKFVSDCFQAVKWWADSIQVQKHFFPDRRILMTIENLLEYTGPALPDMNKMAANTKITLMRLKLKNMHCRDNDVVEKEHNT